MADESINEAIRRILAEGGTPFQIEQRLTRYVIEREAAVRADAAREALTTAQEQMTEADLDDDGILADLIHKLN